MNTKDSISNYDTLIRAVCTFVFVLFAFFYLYYYQSGLLTVMQHVFSEGQTHYDRLIGAVLITLVLLLLQMLVVRVCRKTHMPWFAAFLPSAACLAALTDVDVSPTDGTLRFGLFAVGLPVVLLAYAALVYAGHSSGLFFACSKLQVGPVRRVWGNLLGLLLAMLAVCAIGNGDRSYHDRIYVERCIMDGDLDEALHTMRMRGTADGNTTMLVAYALSRSGQLGEHLFEYPLAGKSGAMMPNGHDIRFELLPDSSFYSYLGGWYVQRMSTMGYLHYQQRHHRMNRRTADYLLCAYLMDRNLDGFAKTIGKYYEVNDSTPLPKHYREALLLYGHLRSNPVVVYADNTMEADYQDFRKLEKSIADPRERRTAMRDTYGNTYWYYYEY